MPSFFLAVGMISVNSGSSRCDLLTPVQYQALPVEFVHGTHLNTIGSLFSKWYLCPLVKIIHVIGSSESGATRLIDHGSPR